MSGPLPLATSARARGVRALPCECRSAPVRRVTWFDIGDVVTLLIASGTLVYALFVFVSRTESHVGFHESKEDVARATMAKYAFEAYPEWVAAQPDQRCPASLADLSPFMHTRDTRDPWGEPYEMGCGMHGILVHSLGPDRVANTGDDLWSPP